MTELDLEEFSRWDLEEDIHLTHNFKLQFKECCTLHTVGNLSPKWDKKYNDILRAFVDATMSFQILAVCLYSILQFQNSYNWSNIAHFLKIFW